MPKTLRVGILSRPHTLNPREARDSVSTLALAQIFETPYATARSDAPAAPVLFDGPLAAEGEGIVSAAVRAGVKFSDGTPLTAALVAASLARVDAMREQAIVQAKGDRVLFTLKGRNPRFDLALTLMHCGVGLEKGADLIGTGAYMRAPGSTIDNVRLVKNPHYREPVAIDEIVFTVHPPGADGRPEALLKAIAAGEVDFTNMLSRGDSGEVQGMRKGFQPSNSTAILYINAERPDLQHKDVRRGLALALDRMALTQLSYTNALAFVASNLLPPMMGSGWDGFNHDPAKSKTLLSQPGLPRPGRLKLVTVWSPRPYLPHPQRVAELIAKQLSVVGVTVDVVVPKSSDEFFKANATGDYDLLLGGWIADTPDPADFFEANLRGDKIPRPGGTGTDSVNRARLKSPEMDLVLKRFRDDPSPANRSAVLERITDEAPLVPLMYGPTVVVTSWKVKGPDVSALGVPRFAAFDIEG